MSYSNAAELESTSLKNKIRLYKKITSKYPGYVPVVVLSSPNNETNNRWRFIVSKEQSFGSVINNISKNININSTETIFALIKTKNGKYIALPKSLSICEIQSSYCGEDGFLWICLMKENTFGK